MTVERVIEMIEGLVGRTVSERDAEEMVELVMVEMSHDCRQCNNPIDLDEDYPLCGGCAIDAGIDVPEVPQ